MRSRGGPVPSRSCSRSQEIDIPKAAAACLREKHVGIMAGELSDIGKPCLGLPLGEAAGKGKGLVAAPILYPTRFYQVLTGLDSFWNTWTESLSPR